jgi:hypothetical protein
MMSSEATAAHAAIVQAIKAAGTIVRIDAEDFSSLVRRNQKPLVVHARGNFFTARHHYLTSYKGLAFYAKSDREVELPADVELIEAKSIWMPS